MFKQWCVFLCLVTMMAGSGVKMQEDAPAHITPANAYLDDYAANALLTTEEFSTAAFLQTAQLINMVMVQISQGSKKPEPPVQLSSQFYHPPSTLSFTKAYYPYPKPAAPAQRLEIPTRAKVPQYKTQVLRKSAPFHYRKTRKRHPGQYSERQGGEDMNESSSRRPTTVFVSAAQDCDEGHLIYKVGNLLQNRYKLMAELGEGTYGKVFMCNDLHTGTILAIKIIKNNVKYHQDVAKREINVLSKLANFFPKAKNMFVQMYDWFDYNGHKFIVFELLGKSVRHFLKDNNYSAYPIEHVRQIAYELCVSVSYLHANRLTHNDLKLENILFHDDEYYKDYLTKEDREKGKKVMILKNPEIRLIDFGRTTFDHEHPSIDPRQDRAPEVIMELGFGQPPSDVWSVGCIIFEMAIGFKMFNTHSRHEHLAMMERILGKIPSKMAEKSKLKYFSKGKLISDEDSSNGRHVRREVKPLLSYIPREKRGNEDWKELFQMISQMLRYEPSKRITLVECLDHPFLKKFKLRGPSRFTSS